jgi:hypothetical protein
MKDLNVKTRNTIFRIIVILLLVPLVLGPFKFLKLAPLKGAIAQPEEKKFSIKDWFSCDYQVLMEKYVNETFGFRNFFIRINNQIAYSLFDKANANGVIYGKNNYMFEENYIKAYYGKDFIGNDSIKNRLLKLKFLQDTLHKLNKNIIIVFAAGKGSYYPEYFPDKYKTEKKITNYECYLDNSRKLGIDYIDFNQHFLNLKKTSEYPLYPQYGIHWSIYGAWLAADSIIHYIENVRKIKMPYFKCNSVEWAQPRSTDYDIGDGMNLLFHLRSFKMAYPQMELITDVKKVKPSLLVISDSFYWLLFGSGFTAAFGANQFWYYNNQIYPSDNQEQIQANQLNTKEEILKYDVIIIMATEATLPGLGWGFIENLYNEFKGIAPKPKYNAAFMKKVNELIVYIRTDNKWYKAIVEKAKTHNIPVDSMLKLDAIFQVEQANKK